MGHGEKLNKEELEECLGLKKFFKETYKNLNRNNLSYKNYSFQKFDFM